MDQIFSKLQKLAESMESCGNSSGTSSQDLTRCSSATKSKVYYTDWEKHQKIHKKNSIHVRCSQRHFLWKQKTMKKNVWQTLDSYLYMQEDLVKDNGHSLVLVPKRSGTL